MFVKFVDVFLIVMGIINLVGCLKPGPYFNTWRKRYVPAWRVRLTMVPISLIVIGVAIFQLVFRRG